jgi:exonuclease SbcD
MKILHTSDWHLGKKLERFSRLEEQKLVMDEICEIADTQDVDAIVVAGDIFDTFNPPTEAVELFYRTVRKLSNNAKRPVVVIAGNHDSADRIEAPDPLARELGIVFVGYPNSKIHTFELESGLKLVNTDYGFLEFKLPNNELLRVVTTPYANEQRLKSFLGVDDAENELRELLENNWRDISRKYCDNKGVNILTAHLFFMKKGEKIQAEPDDEKPILHIGGAQAIFSNSIPEEIQYTALGHLHRKQIIDDSISPVVYSGTPIAYSFGESNQDKFVAIVDIEPNKKAEIDFVEVTKGKRLLRKEFDDLEEAKKWLSENTESLVEITLVMDNYLKADDKKSLYDIHSGIINIIPKVNFKKDDSKSEKQTINLNENLPELFKQYFSSRNAGQNPNEDVMDLFNEIISKN